MRLFHRALVRARIRRTDAEGRTVDLHALRHTAASRWARRGVPLTVAQRMLGHQDVRLTASVYTHVGVEDLRSALDAAPALGRRVESA
jgi:site-specific recombinase XerD